MKIALFSDVHANLPAFDAVLKDIDARMPDAIYCLGDLIGYNVWPNEVIQEIRNRRITTIAGNHDLKVHLRQAHYENLQVKNYAYSIVGEIEKEFLLTLPAHIRLEFKIEGQLIQALFVHGSPRKVDEYLLEDMDEDLLLTIMQEANADILCFGHSHKPYHRIIRVVENGNTKFKHAINLGSVGKPKDGNPKACYVSLGISSQSTLRQPSGIEVEFIRISYDIEKATKAIEESPLSNEFAQLLIDAR
jgi:putative phosphoesterase